MPQSRTHTNLNTRHCKETGIVMMGLIFWQITKLKPRGRLQTQQKGGNRKARNTSHAAFTAVKAQADGRIYSTRERARWRNTAGTFLPQSHATGSCRQSPHRAPGTEGKVSQDGTAPSPLADDKTGIG